ncbi:MAG: hypothetical protein ACTS5I_03235, partial [Rhodanobacter sp.]
MSRTLSITGIAIHANNTSCAYHCRYCQLATSKPKSVSFTRHAALVERFIDWQAANAVEPFEVWPWYGNSYEHDLPTLAGILRLDQRLGREHKVLLLGGLRHRTRSEMHEFLEARCELGIDTLVATFSGHGERHDHWNNKADNYRFQIDSLHLAAEMGMELQQRILLMRNDLSGLESVLNDLDEIDSRRFTRWAIPMFYSGRARHLESERLTVDDFVGLSSRLRACLREDWPNWQSERQWMDQVCSGADEAQRTSLFFAVTEASLEWAERHSCEEILASLEARYRESASRLPSTRALAERYGERASQGGSVVE